MPNHPTSNLIETAKEVRKAHGLEKSEPLLAKSFQQAWRAAPEPNFEPAYAELHIEDKAFVVVAVLGDQDIGNSATGFNEPIWQTGDVFEIFIQVDADTYYEFHITPENRHLFLAWTSDLFAALRAKEATLEDAMINERDLLQSETRIREDAGHWTVHARIPFEKIGLDPKKTYPDLKVAFARYDSFGDGHPDILSATPDFPAINYHDRSVWHPLRF